MPRTGSQTITATGTAEVDSDTLFDSSAEKIRPMLGVFLYAETEDIYVHIDGLHAANEFERLLPYTPVERVVYHPLKKIGRIERIVAYSASGNGILTWGPIAEIVE